MSKQPCPLCREIGKDTKGNNLTVFGDGGGYCHAGHGTVPKHVIEGGTPPPAKRAKAPKVSTMKLDEVLELPTGTHPDRAIPPPIEDKYNVRTEMSETTGKPFQTYYPLYEKGTVNVLGYKVRRYPKEFRPNIGGSPQEVWGKPVCKVTGHHLLIVEGEEDCLAAHAILNKAPAIKMDVVSLPNGASVSEVVKKDVEFFSKYKRIYINLDPDAAGKKAQSELCDWMSGVTDVYNIVIDGSIGKDASDYWVAEKGNDYRKAIKDAKLFTPDGVVNGMDILLDELLEPTPEGYRIPFDGIQRKLHGVRKGEILTVCAGSGIGKSTVVREITKSLIEQKLSIANVALEDQMNVAAQALIALDMDIPLSKFRFDPPTKEEVQPHYDKMVGNGDTYFYKHFGGLTADTLMDKMYYYAKSKEVDFIILDHLSMVISASNSNNERQDIDKLMTELSQMVVETGVGLIQIVHLKRSGGDKSFAKGGEVELTDLRGSAALEQLSWGVMALERDQQGDDPNEICARILKNRTWGFTGLADYMKYDPETGRVHSIVKED